ncbi:HD-GYP domain-containing protein [Gellertiella hungarica]|uniref:Putative nucleotidyltransferase with HDIG domain n=1 Tax=Gellertiella hungarica TaxID=1572859 RepID=A0A7W6NL56_9HYPH|nr:HD-GYP domain-containing protein [Gellertiella hungarica]MBB4065095.1 putative nucleotidyltransferase with HDIG domain [Gellertiella hungarica]
MTVVRIPKGQLRKGMYVESVECPQFVFSKRRFILDLDEDLDAIAAAPAEFVLVNTARSKGAMGAASSGKANGNGDAPAQVDEVKRQKAAETLTRSTAAVKTGFTGFATGDIKDIQAFAPVSRDLIESMSEGPEIVLELTRLKTKDEGTFLHSLAVGALMASVGQALGYDEATVELLGIAGILHDFGKLLIPNMILNKRGSLSDVERQIIRNHPELGYQRLVTYPDMPGMVLDVCRHHHELLDGSGYPQGLSGAALSPFVRISTICDVYDALTSTRPYKKAWSGQQAINWMFEQGHCFDRRLLLRLGEVTDGAGRG